MDHFEGKPKKNEALQLVINANWSKDYEFENEVFWSMNKNIREKYRFHSKCSYEKSLFLRKML